MMAPKPTRTTTTSNRWICYNFTPLVAPLNTMLRIANGSEGLARDRVVEV